jgi:pimeloyl-ACP methyl ester carboxylesterase
MLGYAEYGDPAGTPLMVFHGLPGSRLMAAFAHDAAFRRGIRIVSPDRPGYGLSTYRPRRRILDWPDDLLQLADALGIDRFAVAGVSSGGPYVSVCAYAIPERLSGAAIVSGATPMNRPGYYEGMHRRNRMTWRLTKRVPPASRLLAWLSGRFITRASGERLARMMSSDLPPADRAIVGRPELQSLFVADAREAFRDGARGVAHEFGLTVRPWGFRLEDIRIPVHVWHGTEDRNIPVSHARYVADAIPNCIAHICEGAGHLLVVDRIEEILDTIVPRV